MTPRSKNGGLTTLEQQSGTAMNLESETHLRLLVPKHRARYNVALDFSEPIVDAIASLRTGDMVYPFKDEKAARNIITEVGRKHGISVTLVPNRNRTNHRLLVMANGTCSRCDPEAHLRLIEPHRRWRKEPPGKIGRAHV